MPPIPQLVSPRQAARALGVSESSLKRWCDQGLIKTVRTAGGHRKLPTSDILRFLREGDHELVCPDALGLPPATPGAAIGLARGRSRLVESLLAGQEALARQIVLELYLARQPLCAIFDDVVARAFYEIGELWACQQADVYQERRGCQIMQRILFELRRLLPAPQERWPALGGTISGDLYSLPSLMAELVLREAGFDANCLGTSLPMESLSAAVLRMRPKLFWLSVSFIREDIELETEWGRLAETCAQVGAALVVGGRALEPDVRLRITYSAYCDTMRHLEAFAKTWAGTLQSGPGENLAGSGDSPPASHRQTPTINTEVRPL